MDFRAKFEYFNCKITGCPKIILMCSWIRISNLFHLNTLKISIQNIKGSVQKKRGPFCSLLLQRGPDPPPLVVPWESEIFLVNIFVVVDAIGLETDFTLETNRKRMKETLRWPVLEYSGNCCIRAVHKPATAVICTLFVCLFVYCWYWLSTWCILLLNNFPMFH